MDTLRSSVWFVGSACQQHAELCPGPIPSDESQVAANGAEIDGPIGESVSADIDASTSCLDEDESDDDIYNEICVPSHLIDEATELSAYHDANTLPYFEKKFAQERSFTQCNGRHA